MVLCPVVFLGVGWRAERDAQAAKRGLWADDYPVPP
jgi:endonuclease YncB( thermonuclease family)